ncbi:cupin domain-containing protein [Sneathiella aquimaris]|uniref:cupin domain-containing protein n=1 Tax=Sneathiella aquimaris TaxID=2599305 RepID=UPI00146F29AD|nr:cupin domain-containing protein [Sneathiella aquimaris]
MGLRFIFMLTRDDKTVTDARLHLQTALNEGIHHIGFKDVGLPFNQLKTLNKAIKDGGATSYLEVVSLDKSSEIRSAKAALEIGVDILLGGTHVDDVLPLLQGSEIQYFPFPGKIVGHPSVLEGTIEEISEDARRLAQKDGVDGLDLLAYRSGENVQKLMTAVCKVTDKPVIMAGSIDNRGRIQDIKDAGGAGFTIGTAALNDQYSHEPGLEKQLRAIMKDVAKTNDHISPYRKQSLAQSFSAAAAASSDVIEGRLNNMRVRLERIEHEGNWSYHPSMDEMIFVHKGTLTMKFRDRDETVGEGEFIIIPQGVEYCPVPKTESCDVMMLGAGD